MFAVSASENLRTLVSQVLARALSLLVVIAVLVAGACRREETIGYDSEPMPMESPSADYPMDTAIDPGTDTTMTDSTWAGTDTMDTGIVPPRDPIVPPRDPLPPTNLPDGKTKPR